MIMAYEKNKKIYLFKFFQFFNNYNNYSHYLSFDVSIEIT